MVNFRKITEENFDAIIKMKRPEGPVVHRALSKNSEGMLSPGGQVCR